MFSQEETFCLQHLISCPNFDQSRISIHCNPTAPMVWSHSMFYTFYKWVSSIHPTSFSTKQIRLRFRPQFLCKKTPGVQIPASFPEPSLLGLPLSLSPASLVHPKKWGYSCFLPHPSVTGKDYVTNVVSQKEKDKYHMLSLTCGIKIWDKWTYLPDRNRLTETENRLVVAKGEGRRRGDGLGVWD